MPPRRNLTPSYLLHKQSGRGRLVWTGHTGARQQKLLPGPFGSPESLEAKARLELELATSPIAAVTDRNGITVAEVLVAYLEHAERYYRDPDGKPGSETVNIKRSIKPVRELSADLPAAEFGPLALKAGRQHTVGLCWCRLLVNGRTDRVKRAFAWPRPRNWCWRVRSSFYMNPEPLSHLVVFHLGRPSMMLLTSWRTVWK